MKIIYILIFCSSICISCKKFFDIEPTSVIVAENFYKNEKEAMQGLVGVYDALQPQSGMYDLGMWQLVDGGTDNIMGNTGNQPINNYAFGPDQVLLRDAWQALYDGIFRANLLLQNIENSDEIPQEVNLRLQAEARFLRALFYFNLVNLWGGVPLVTRVLSSDELIIPKNTPEEVYQFIEDDLMFAASILPARSELSPAETGRATSGAALALLAKSYLFEKKWALAASTANQVIQSNEYQILPDYLSVFNESNENNAEMIFCVKFAALQGETQLFSQYQEPQGYGQSVPTDDLVSAFEADDKRKNVSIIVEGDFIVNPGFRIVPSGYTLQSGESVDPDFVEKNGSAAFTKKWWGNKFWTKDGWLNIIRPVDNSSDFPVIRFADVILMRAEALAENNQLDSAAFELNKIRTRAGLQNAQQVVNVNDKTQLINLLRNDRRIELINECSRMFDLRRWGILIEQLQKVNKPAEAPKNLLYPIPQVEIDLHKGALQQNPGW